MAKKMALEWASIQVKNGLRKSRNLPMLAINSDTAGRDSLDDCHISRDELQTIANIAQAAEHVFSVAIDAQAGHVCWANSLKTFHELV